MQSMYKYVYAKQRHQYPHQSTDLHHLATLTTWTLQQCRSNSILIQFIFRTLGNSISETSSGALTKLVVGTSELRIWIVLSYFASLIISYPLRASGNFYGILYWFSFMSNQWSLADIFYAWSWRTGLNSCFNMF